MGDFLNYLRNVHMPTLFHKKKRGQAVVEAAIAIPILIALLVIIVDLGRMTWSKIVLTNAARESAYYLSYHADSNDAAATAVAALEAQKSGISFIGLAASSGGTCCTEGQPVIVTVSATVNGFILSDAIVMSNPIIMMVQK
jgi:Flp pilus assembly protein TadG